MNVKCSLPTEYTLHAQKKHTVKYDVFVFCSITVFLRGLSSVNAFVQRKVVLTVVMQSQCSGIFVSPQSSQANCIVLSSFLIVSEMQEVLNAKSALEYLIY